MTTIPAINRVRTSDPQTSFDAAESNDIHGSQVSVLLTLSFSGPLADHELVERIADYSPSRIRTARSELVDMGMVEFTGFYRLTAGNRRTQVWQVVKP